MTKIGYAGYRFPPVIIQQAVWLYARFTLSFRDVEDLLAERGIMVSYETVRPVRLSEPGRRRRHSRRRSLRVRRVRIRRRRRGVASCFDAFGRQPPFSLARGVRPRRRRRSARVPARKIGISDLDDGMYAQS